MSSNFFSKNALLLLSILIYIASLINPCYQTGPERPEQLQGLGLLLSGWLGFMLGWVGFIWLANPILFLSWILHKKKNNFPLVCAIIALVLGLLFLTIKEIMINEAGHKAPITHHLLGYWLWISSMVINLVNICKYRITNKTINP